MSGKIKAIIFLLMVSALIFGFVHLAPGNRTLYDFERLHIFLFNLCSGGTLIVVYTEGAGRLTGRGTAFLALSVAYAFLAFFRLYVPAAAISILMSLLVEWIRIRKFSFVPVDFFSMDVPVARKFHHAALLCLSIGLFISAMVIVNNEYLMIVKLKKLQLNTFFLGFSFPVSLITMSVMFSFLKGPVDPLLVFLRHAGFWIVNAGVVVFFVFILLEVFILQLIVTIILFISVIMIFYVFYRVGVESQEKVFLTSGMWFLVFTAVTGILYISLELFAGMDLIEYNRDFSLMLLKIHAFASLYGWNLSGLSVIARSMDFPLKLNMIRFVFLHWITVIVLAPLGRLNPVFAVLAVIMFIYILYNIFFSGNSHSPEPA